MKNPLNWPKKVTPSRFLHTGQSDRDILEIRELTNAYLQDNEGIVNKINEILWVYRAMIDLIPQTLEKATSGHVFPISECGYELESSIQLCKLGFYKHAIIALRNVLELGLLSVYWDIDGNSHINIPKWLSSNEQTPFHSKVIEELKKNKQIVAFDEEHNIFTPIRDLYHELCDFSHTKGISFSSTELSRGNFNRFNGESIRRWLDFMERVVKIVITIHILQYPVGLQDINLFGKFGLNPPIGGLLRSNDVERVRKFLDKGILETLQTISDADLDASRIAQQINDLPDITQDQIRVQEEHFEKLLIKCHPSGYRGWFKQQKKNYKSYRRECPKVYKIKVRRWKKLKMWAKENGYFEKFPSASGND